MGNDKVYINKTVISHFCNGEGIRRDLLTYKNVEIYRLGSALQRVTLRQGYGMTNIYK